MDESLNTEPAEELGGESVQTLSGNGASSGLTPIDRKKRYLPDCNRHLSHCSCGHPLFFDDSVCSKCQMEVGFDPFSSAMQILATDGPQRFRRCGNYNSALSCNWLLEVNSSFQLCLSCALTRICPNLSQPENHRRWMQVEGAKRRVIAAVWSLGLPLDGLYFDFLETPPGEAPILTGHRDGLITLNIEEADDPVRERIRTHFHEPYRTLVGHLRHELGHFYWNRLIVAGNQLQEYRDLFGDESVHYDSALQTYHFQGAASDWENSFVSAYATAHPHEDWAETFAHYLHMREGLASADAMGLQVETERLACDPFQRSDLLRTNDSSDREFLEDVNRWCVISRAVNELNRSMGQPDLYPFTLSTAVVRKLQFVHRVISRAFGSVTDSSDVPCLDAA